MEISVQKFAMSDKLLDLIVLIAFLVSASVVMHIAQTRVGNPAGSAEWAAWAQAFAANMTMPLMLWVMYRQNGHSRRLLESQQKLTMQLMNEQFKKQEENRELEQREVARTMVYLFFLISERTVSALRQINNSDLSDRSFQIDFQRSCISNCIRPLASFDWLKLPSAEIARHCHHLTTILDRILWTLKWFAEDTNRVRSVTLDSLAKDLQGAIDELNVAAAQHGIKLRPGKNTTQ